MPDDKNVGGRPPKQPEERLSRVIHFRVTEADGELIDRAASIRGHDLPDWLRKVVLSAAKRATKS